MKTTTQGSPRTLRRRLFKAKEEQDKTVRVPSKKRFWDALLKTCSLLLLSDLGVRLGELCVETRLNSLHDRV